MTPQRLMRSRVNTAFLMMILTLAVQTVVSVPTLLIDTLREFLPMEFLPSYYTDFFLLQFLYPIANCILVLLVLKKIRMPLKSVVSVQPLKGDFVPWLGLFLGVAVVMNYLINGLLALLDALGVTVPDVFVDYTPKDLPQAICYFVVLAILPPIAEEILCRAGITGLLKHFHPRTAVFLSAFAFGLMHGTLQQIPFAFVLGLVLGFVYIKTGNILYPILLHFANNAWACVMTYLPALVGDTATAIIGYAVDGIFLLFGVLSLLYLLRKKQFTLAEIPSTVPSEEVRPAVVKAPAFWIFTGLYGFVTVTNIFTPALIEKLTSLLEELENLPV